MAEYKTPGQLAYEGFSDRSGGKSVITSEPLPSWGAQIQAVKDSWEAAAAAVTRATNAEPPKPQADKTATQVQAEQPKPKVPEPPKTVTPTPIVKPKAS